MLDGTACLGPLACGSLLCIIFRRAHRCVSLLRGLPLPLLLLLLLLLSCCCCSCENSKKPLAHEQRRMGLLIRLLLCAGSDVDLPGRASNTPGRSTHTDGTGTGLYCKQFIPVAKHRNRRERPGPGDDVMRQQWCCRGARGVGEVVEDGNDGTKNSDGRRRIQEAGAEERSWNQKLKNLQ